MRTTLHEHYAKAPKAIRGRLISFNQISMTGGILIAFWINYFLRASPTGWRWAMAGQCVPAIIILLASPLLPRSPRWLVQNGQLDAARRVLIRLRGGDSGNIGEGAASSNSGEGAASSNGGDVAKGGSGNNSGNGGDFKCEAEREFDEMVTTIRADAAAKEDAWSFLFTDPLSRRRLLLCVVLQCGQQLTGINVIMYFMPFIAQDVGFGANGSDLLAQGVQGIVNFLSTWLAFCFVDHVSEERGERSKERERIRHTPDRETEKQRRRKGEREN